MALNPEQFVDKDIFIAHRRMGVMGPLRVHSVEAEHTKYAGSFYDVRVRTKKGTQQLPVGPNRMFETPEEAQSFVDSQKKGR